MSAIPSRLISREEYLRRERLAETRSEFEPPPLVLQSINCTLAADDVYRKVEAEEEA